MEKTEKRPALRGLIERHRATMQRCAVVVGAGLAILPAMTSAVALQDMTSLLEGSRNEARWQATFIPSPAGSIETATVSFADGADLKHVPKGAGLQVGAGVYTMRTKRESFETPDETRINRREKGARVLAATPPSLPKAFSAGSVLERQSLLRPSIDLSSAVFTSASAEPVASDHAIEVAMAFAPSAPNELPDSKAKPDRVMIAAIQSKKPVAKSAAGTIVASVAATEISALGYAAAEPASQSAASLFGRILQGAGKGFVPPLGRDDHAWAATPLPAAAFSAKEQTCLATGIYFEARGESEEGQAAVAQVILNRVRNPTYPKTICGVVYQNKTWRNRCQFSFACDAIKDRILNKRAYARAKDIAQKVSEGEIWLADVGSSTHYHATYVHPRWADAMQQVDKIGRHIFYRTYGGGWN